MTFQTGEESLEELLKQVAGNSSLMRKYGDTIASNSTRGQGAVIGATGAHADDGTQFISPVQFAPPSWHVLDTDGDDEDGDGFSHR